MELHPSPHSWRIALVTAIGSGSLLIVALAALFERASAPALWALIALASLATFLPAAGTLSASVEADRRGVTVRRFGRVQHYAWANIAAVAATERRANVPDGTEYHWVWPTRRHMVAVPYLELTDGTRRELPALSAPAGTASADAYADQIRAQGVYGELVTTSG